MIRISRKKIAWITAVVMAVTVFGGTSVSFATNGESDANQPLASQDEDSNPGDGGNQDSIASEPTAPVKPNQPANLCASGESDNTVQLSWDEVNPQNGGIIKYNIYTSDNEDATPLNTEPISELKYSADYSDAISFYIKAVETYTVNGEEQTISSDKKAFGNISKAVTKVNNLGVDPGRSAVLLEWDMVDDADYYEIYRAEGGELGHQESDGTTVTTNYYRNVKSMGSFEKAGTISQQDAVDEWQRQVEGTSDTRENMVGYRDGGRKDFGQYYAYVYEYYVVAVYDDISVGTDTIVRSQASEKQKENTVITMLLYHKMKKTKPYFKNATTMKTWGKLSKNKTFISYNKYAGRLQVRYGSKTVWVAQKNTKNIVAFYQKNGDNQDLTRVDQDFGYSAKTVLDYVNTNAGFKSKTNRFIWVNKYTQHAYVFQGSVGHWQLVDDTHWSNLAASGRTTMNSRGGFFTKYKRISKLKRSKYDYFYASALCSTVRLHSILYKKKASFSSTKYYDKTLGSPRSKGCIRLKPSAAYYIYDYANIPKNTLVYVY